ncbi:hypothetical protein R16034_04039 [Ralstonia edaphis]|uniref:Uncharacterized protein n=1 Tax=Ralstonia edaphi TaxID=3058599 RepID=A0AB72X7J0_9RALS|nr:hypothetical protein [Ralstonia sp. LMG 6871]CAJ0744024.1 hypothetical protein R16034_04039 [Ralstonia sp. LMG 6871]
MMEAIKFAARLFTALASGDLNVVGLIVGFIGGLMVTVFGLPSIGLLNEGMYVEIEVTWRMRIYNGLARLGLVMIMAGFLLQLIPAVKAVHVP